MQALENKLKISIGKIFAYKPKDQQTFDEAFLLLAYQTIKTSFIDENKSVIDSTTYLLSFLDILEFFQSPIITIKKIYVTDIDDEFFKKHPELDQKEYYEIYQSILGSLQTRIDMIAEQTVTIKNVESVCSLVLSNIQQEASQSFGIVHDIHNQYQNEIQKAISSISESSLSPEEASAVFDAIGSVCGENLHINTNDEKAVDELKTKLEIAALDALPDRVPSNFVINMKCIIETIKKMQNNGMA